MKDNLIKYFEGRDLLRDGKGNTKTAKNNVQTFYLSLQPTDLNSKKENLCKFSTKECRAMCLQHTGRQGFSNVRQSREKKTEFFVNHKKEFLEKLYNELETIQSKYKKAAIRLNLLSDVNWELEFNEHLDKSLGSLKKIQFYDYTKDFTKIYNNKLPNYHLTLSFSGGNWKYCEDIVKNKLANIAVVFKGKELPSSYQGYKVVDGDKSDMRFKDGKGVIVGLKYKTPHGVDYQKNKFVVEV